MLKTKIQNLLFVASVLFAIPLVSRADSPDTAPSYWNWVPTPPMGWNSYDAWGTSVTEEETLANARYMQEHLLAHGWKFIVIDARWYDAVSPDDDRAFNRERVGARLFADDYGRLIPATNRFPSAAAGKGLKPLADAIHAMGLKFGIHMMRGIPRQAVKAKTPIDGGNFTAADAANTNSICRWCLVANGVSKAFTLTPFLGWCERRQLPSHPG